MVLWFDSGLKASQLVYSKIFTLILVVLAVYSSLSCVVFLRFGLPPFAPPRVLAIIRGYLPRNKI